MPSCRVLFQIPLSILLFLATVSVLFGTGETAVAFSFICQEKPAAKTELDKNTEPKTAKAILPQDWADKVTWRSIGPANMGGRITALAVYEKDPNIWWAASASGGLLKTSNNGITFEHQFDDQATVSIGDVQVSQSDPEIVWVGTGESNPRNSVSWGDGVYKSIDGGKTWKNMGLKKTFQTGALAIHPTNPDIVWVGSLGRLWGANKERGLFKTVDGGKNWKKILYVDDKTGVIDVQIDMKNPDNVLVATYERKRDQFDGNDPEQRFGAGSGIYKSSDGGDSFKRITDGLPTCKIGRIGIDYFEADPDYVYAVIESEKIAKEPPNAPFMGIRGENAEVGAKVTSVTKDGPAATAGLKDGDLVVSVEGRIVMSLNDFLGEVRKHRAGDKIELIISRDREKIELEIELGKQPEKKSQRTPFTGTLGGQAANLQDQQGDDGFEFGGIYESSNGGDTWQRINSLNPRPMYYSNIQVDPVDRNNIYVCGTSLYKSKDGGKTFTNDGGTDGIHVDHHALWINRRDPRHMILGNDGGIYVTNDRMTHWDHLNHFAIAQFYHVGVGSNRDYNVYGGLQDNGSWGGPSRGRFGIGPVNSDWFRVGGGDGFVTIPDPDDPDQIYFESQNGGMGRIHLLDGSRGFIRPRPPRGSKIKYRFNWKTPFILSPHNSKIHYSAGNYVFRSFQKGNGIKAISPEIPNTDKGAGSAISESATDAGLIYVGTNDGAVWKTDDAGASWQPLFYQPQPKESKKGVAQGDSDTKDSEDEQGAEVEDVQVHEEKVIDDSQLEEKDSPKSKQSPETAKSKTEDIDIATDDSVSGIWDALIEDENFPGGSLEFTINLQMNDENELSGSINSSQGDSDITDGVFNEDKGRIVLNAENEEFSLELQADINDGKMAGSISIADGQLEVEFEATRQDPGSADDAIDADEAQDDDDSTDPPSVEGNKPIEKTESEETESEETESEETEAAEMEAAESESEPGSDSEASRSTDSDDPVSGKWEGTFRSQQGERDFSLALKMIANDSITGVFESTRGEREITSGSFEPKTNKLVLVAESEQFTLSIGGVVIGNNYEGEIDVNDGAFTMDFSLTRESEQPAETESKAGSDPSQSVIHDRQKNQPRILSQPTGAKSLSNLLPGPRWVSSIDVSKFKKDRCYITFDGHRHDDDSVYVFVTNDGGQTWSSLKNNLPDSAGSVRVIREDIKNENLLFLGCEFSSWYSVDAGNSWTRIMGGLPTVAVHEFAMHPTSGEVVAGTHGRSLWIGNVSILRQISEQSIASDVHLYQPREAVLWKAKPRRGSSGTRRFVGNNPASGTSVAYSLGKNARDISLEIRDLRGTTIKTFDASKRKGLHMLDWNLRRDQKDARPFGSTVPAGSYLLILRVDGQRHDAEIKIVDPENVR